MEVNIAELVGAWDLGYSLDKHTISSIPIGPNEFGHMQFDTTRSEVGEALFQLKYRSNYAQIVPIANQIYDSLSGLFPTANLIIPMPASKHRERQPVTEIARELARLMNIPCEESMLVKKVATPPMKDIETRDEKVQTLMGALTINNQINKGPFDVLLVDDLFDTGSSLEAATKVLRQCPKIEKIFIATLTRKR